jgi:hypothetical protein
MVDDQSRYAGFVREVEAGDRHRDPGMTSAAGKREDRAVARVRSNGFMALQKLTLALISASRSAKQFD